MMATTHRLAPVAQAAKTTTECPSPIVVEFSSRPVIDEVLEEEEEIRRKEVIASAQVSIKLAMAMKDMFGSPAKSPILDEPMF